MAQVLGESGRYVSQEAVRKRRKITMSALSMIGTLCFVWGIPIGLPVHALKNPRMDEPLYLDCLVLHHPEYRRVVPPQTGQTGEGKSDGTMARLRCRNYGLVIGRGDHRLAMIAVRGNLGTRESGSRITADKTMAHSHTRRSNRWWPTVGP